jgi:hypothetical protein
MEDRIICYYTFLRIGLAVALWTRDFLLFNPQEPHSISSQCKAETKYTWFHLILKQQLLVAMIIVTLLYRISIKDK